MGTAVVSINPDSDVEIQDHYEEACKLRDYALQRVVQSLDDAQSANDDLSMIATLKKAMEAKKKEYTVPLEAHKKAIIASFQTLMQPIEEADRITRDKLIAYKQELSAKQAEEERINALRLEAARAEMDLKGEITKPVDLVEVSEISKRVSTNLGTSTVIKVPKWKVVNFSAVPDECKLIDGGKVTRLVKAGIGTIAGIEIYTEDSLRVTTR